MMVIQNIQRIMSWKTVRNLFKFRIEPKDMASKMADVWPIENIWGILYEKLRGEDTKTEKELIRKINKIWRNIGKEVCTKMMESIPIRLNAVIHINGNQIKKSDYSS